MISTKLATRRSGFSMIGVLITMVCIVVLFSIMMTQVNKSVTGEGSQHEGTVRSFEDKLYLTGIFQSMVVHATDNKGQYIVPSEVSASKDVSQDNSANLFSAMVMQNYTPCKQLISGNEYSGYVEEKTDYDFGAYDPKKHTMWDTTFVADLQKLSNVSYAHMPLCGDRFKKQWRTTMSSTFPLLGNRGPKDGVNNPNSYACGRDGVWRGHIVFGEGHIDFIEAPSPNGMVFEQGGQRTSDNIFKMESGANGADAVLGFTKAMSKNGPELQFD
jgi:hypothetical protein